MFHKCLTIALVLSFSTAAFSSNRVNESIASTSEERLTKIVELQNNLVKGRKEIANFETELSKVQKSSENHKSYVSIRNTSAIVLAASTIAIGASMLIQSKRMGIYKLSGRLPNPTDAEEAFAIIGLIGIPASALFVAGSEVGVLLTKDEATQLISNLNELKKSLENQSKEFVKELDLLCKADPRHEVCYLDHSYVLFNK